MTLHSECIDVADRTVAYNRLVSSSRPMSEGWLDIVSHYERCLAEHGVSPEGVDWPNAVDLEARFASLLSIVDTASGEGRPVLLDVGCGPGLLLDYLQATGRLNDIDYRGVDLSSRMVDAAANRWPA